MRKSLVGCYWWCTATTTTTHRQPSSSLYIFITLLFLVKLPGSAGIFDSVPPTTKYKEVTSVAGSVGQIPCPVTSFNDVVMILWFKGYSGAPIYSYDARNVEAGPRQMTLKDEWGLRLYFRVWPNNRRHPALMIQELKPKDSGLYRCRVDYRNSPTTNSVTRLKIIEPPTRLEIRDTSPSRPISDQQMLMSGNNKHSDASLSYLGPYKEGQNVTLVCSAYGGKPLPEVRWYKNGDMVDTSYSLSGTEYAINEMTINSLGRNHTLDIYSCQANNNNETQALTHKVQLEIYLGVTSVELEIPSPMTAGSEYSLVCKTMGAYPTIKVEFWKNLKRIASRSQMKSMADNMTVTSILYKPEVGDDGTILICKAENPWVSKKPSVARKTMKIKYAPVTVLRLGRNRTTAFSEGESVLLECHVKANPPAHTVMCFHQGRELRSDNETSGIIIKGMTLFISYLTHQVGGDYYCEAVNSIGKGRISNTISIELHLSPKCVTSEATQVPLAIGETQWLTCNVLAWPSDLNFYWTLNRSDSTSNGEIRRSSSDGDGTTFRNLTEYYRLPISSVAQGINNNVTVTTTGSDVSISKSNLERGEEDGAVAKKAEQRSSNQTGYPQLSSGSSSGSLDYPEDQHMPTHQDASWKNRMTDNTERTRSGSRTTAAGKELNKEKRSSQKDILFEETYSTGGKAISKEGDKKSASMSHPDSATSPSDVAFSTSTRDASASYAYASYYNSSVPFPATANKLTSDISTGESSSHNVVAAGNQSENKQKSKRHTYSSSASSSSYGDGKTRGGDGTAHGFQDKIRHRSLIPYQVKSNEDYGTVACWATNSFGSQVFPCLFHIIQKEDKDLVVGSKGKDRKLKTGSKTKSNNTTDKKQVAMSGNLTASFASVSTAASTTTGKEILEHKLDDSREPLESGGPPQRGFSKLQKTLGIVLLLILIFIAGLSGLAFALLFLLAKRRREIRRIVIAHGRGGGRGGGKPNSSNSSVVGGSNNKSTTNKNGKGATDSDVDDDAVVNKNAPSQNTFLNEENTDSGFASTASPTITDATTILPSDMKFAVAESTKSIYSMDPFQEIAAAGGTENKEKPQLSYISADTATFTNKTASANNNVGCCPVPSPSFDCLFAANKSKDDDDEFLANNRSAEAREKDIGATFPEAFSYFAGITSNTNNTAHCNNKEPTPELSVQAQFVEQLTEREFKNNNMTPRAVELFECGKSSPTSTDYEGAVKGEYTVAHNDCNNLSSYNQHCGKAWDGSHIAGEGVVAEECQSHRDNSDKDCLLLHQEKNQNNLIEN